MGGVGVAVKAGARGLPPDVLAPVLDESWHGTTAGVADQPLGAALPVLQLPSAVSARVRSNGMTVTYSIRRSIGPGLLGV